MSKITQILVASLVLLMASGCGKKDEDAGDKSAEAKGKTATPAAADGDKSAADKPATPASGAASAAATDTPFASYGLAAVAAKWQGTWVLGASSLGRKVVWQVEGAKVKVWNGSEEKTLDFQILAPCYAKTSDKAKGVSTFHKFAFDGETLYAGLGNAGVLTDKGAIACVRAKIYVLEGGACKQWKDRFGKWSSEDAECSLADGVLTIGSSKLHVEGKAIVNIQMKGNKVVKYDSFDAAKAAVTK